MRSGISGALLVGEAPLAVRAGGGRCGEVADQGGVEGAEAVRGAGPFGQPEQWWPAAG